MDDNFFWHVKGSDIVNTDGEKVFLRGLCLGGWMSMENFITGYPGNESKMRLAVAQVLGREKAGFFFERFLDYFLTEEDIQYIAGLGATTVRVALNYRHFEADARPFEYIEEGFARLDQLVGWIKKHGLHIILDLHAVPGYQNPDWHSDNPGRNAHFWGQKQFEDRAIALWKALAQRYVHEPAVAGYNLLNEPVASKDELVWLHRYYRRATEAIRAIDSNHILFLDGNHYAQRCNELEPPFDNNTVYSYHFYPEPVLESMNYPVKAGGVVYDRDWLKRTLMERADFSSRYGVPAWAGEFGIVFTGQSTEEYQQLILRDMLDIMNGAGHHWTLWHYKDIGPMGIMMINHKSEWMQRTESVRFLKSALRCDYWIERKPTNINNQIDEIVTTIQQTAGLPQIDQEKLREDIYASVCKETLSMMLLPAFAEQFCNMSENEIDRMMKSFEFKNCVPRKEIVDLLRNAWQRV
ncbi:MAG: glycoside hydrolase family 5 protein [Flexilinea sp.]